MTGMLSRRDLFRRAAGRPTPMRPPGSGAERDFEAACERCGACAEACPEAILVADAGGLPELTVSHGACTFCGACAEACPTGALRPDRIGAWPWRARIAPSCLSLNGTACRACQDVCDARAIRFRLETGGRAVPLLDPVACTGCGACVGSCPAGAIALTREPAAQTAAQTAERPAERPAGQPEAVS